MFVATKPHKTATAATALFGAVRKVAFKIRARCLD